MINLQTDRLNLRPFKEEDLDFLYQLHANEEVAKKVEVRFAIMPEFWGRGYASELTAALVKFAFEDLGLNEVAAANGPTNEKSHRVLIKSGFKYIKNTIPQGYGNADEIRFYLIER